MKFREAVKIIEGLRFIADELTLMSALGRACLMDSDFIEDRELLKKEYDYLASAVKTVTDAEIKNAVSETERLLMQTRDIRTTVARLEGRKILDDVEFFEIKGLALISRQLDRLLGILRLSHIKSFEIPDLAKVIEILDPEKTGNAHFYIYDAYSVELAQKRQQLKKLQADESHNIGETDKIIAECMMIEDNVRVDLSERLHPYSSLLFKVLETAGRLDLLLAKGHFANKYRLSVPTLTETYIHYTALRYLPIEQRLRDLNKEFQPIDISLNEGVTLITGANMGGKTITLKSLAMAQAMMQFGFGIPARKGGVAPVKKIALSIGDSQSANEGLSSFGSEILQIDQILNDAASDDIMLILIDEPARTTNPEEGKAIVSAIMDILGKRRSISVLTTHYSNIKSNCVRLKVRGVKDTLPADSKKILPGSLMNFMDYSLVPDDTSDVDREALAIARLLGISRNFSETIENNLKP